MARTPQLEAPGCGDRHQKSAQTGPDPFRRTGPPGLRKPIYITALLAAEPTMISPVVVSTPGSHPNRVHAPPVKLCKYT